MSSNFFRKYTDIVQAAENNQLSEAGFKDAIKGAWNGMKQGWNQQNPAAAPAPAADPNAAPAGQPAAPADAGGNPGAPAGNAPAQAPVAGARPEAGGVQQAQQAPAANGQSQQPAAPGAAPQDKRQTDAYEDFKGQVKQLADAPPPPKALPEKMITTIKGDIAKLAKGDKESGTVAADKILKFSKAGYEVSDLAKQFIANAQAGERFLTQSVYRSITNLLKEYDLKWSDLGLRIRLVETRQRLPLGVYISRSKF
jgi:hypothetical protein